MASPAPVAMTQDELKAMIALTAKEAVGPAVKEALEPLTKAQGDVMERLAKALPAAGGAADPLVFDDKTLGKYPFGRKARALALLTLEGKASGAPVTADDIPWAEKVIGKAWNLAAAEPTKKWLQHVKATLLAGVANAAGDMVFPQFDSEWIELLRNNAVVRGLVRTMPMPRGSTVRRKQLTAGTASYQGENDKIAVSNQTVGRAQLSYKKLTAATVVGNDLIRFAGGEADRFVQEDLIAVAALREDRAFLVGNPPTDPGSPQGIRYQTAAANVFAKAGTTLANFQSDLTAAIKNLQKNNVPATPANSGFLMSPSTFWTIYALTTTTGDWVFAQGLAQAQPKILNFPVYLTTQLETANSFIGANLGMVIFAFFPAMEIHDSMQRTVATYVGGAYYDGSTVQSGISNDETVITCIAEHDFFQKYDVAASVVTTYAT